MGVGCVVEDGVAGGCAEVPALADGVGTGRSEGKVKKLLHACKLSEDLVPLEILLALLFFYSSKLSPEK